MKKSVILAALLYSAATNAECENPDTVEYLPAGVKKEFCFRQDIKRVIYGNSMDIEMSVETGDSISGDYKAAGIKSVVNFTARKPGVVSNAFIDIGDDSRVEVTLITTTSKVD